MNILLLSFTDRGKILSQKLIEKLDGRDFDDDRIVVKLSQSKSISQSDFENFDSIIFVGAIGIAVRLIAPFVKDKLTDPGVIVIDEMGKNVIPILSGHFGGANKLSVFISETINAYPVITTASDLAGVIGFDELARANDLVISQRDNIKKVTNGLMKGEAKNLCLSDDIIISSDENDIDKDILGLIFRPIVVGIGCKKEIDSDALDLFFVDTIRNLDIEINQIYAFATIDIKREEAAIKNLSDKYNIPIYYYSAEELEAVEGKFEESDFVKSVTGVGSVSARAAKALGKRGKFLKEKEIKDGMTLSVFEKIRRVTFKY